MARSSGRSGRPWRRLRARILAESGGLCWICLHFGSDSLDHVIPLSLGGAPEDPANLRPAHYSPCPVCHRRCNTSRGNRMFGPTGPRKRKPRPSRAW